MVSALVMGGSAGAFEIMRNVLGGLPASTPFPILVVLHQLPGARRYLREIFAPNCALTIAEGLDKEQLLPGTVYAAPPDYHMYVEDDGTLALSEDPPEHHCRPSIDLLFESAARVHGKSLVGVLLSGANDDGARGLHAIHLAGGRTIVQDPSSAQAPQMPGAALELFQPDAVLSPARLGEFVAKLAQEGMS
jgi:two-component system, chemotaxis family, protein-glutamate methylesterase/glutaminase